MTDILPDAGSATTVTDASVTDTAMTDTVATDTVGAVSNAELEAELQAVLAELAQTQATLAAVLAAAEANGVAGNDNTIGSTENATGAITRERAAEIALAVVDGTLIEVDRDVERGRAVWYVAVRQGGTVHEIYVDRSTGEIVLHETY
jgi:uncharacterized membrane protein YkoI